MDRLVHCETTSLDPDAMSALVRDIGGQGAERFVGRALDEIFDEARRLRRARADGRFHAAEEALLAIACRARDIGLCQVARVARDAAATNARGDPAAASATLARLERLLDDAVHAIGRGWGALS